MKVEVSTGLLEYPGVPVEIGRVEYDDGTTMLFKRRARVPFQSAASPWFLTWIGPKDRAVKAPNQTFQPPEYLATMLDEAAAVARGEDTFLSTLEPVGDGEPGVGDGEA